MAEPNQNPIAELKNLDAQVDQINSMEGLKPIFNRLEEIARDHPYDFETQLLVGDIKQHLVNRGVKIRQNPESQTRRPAEQPASRADEPTMMMPPKPAAPQGPPTMPPPPAAKSANSAPPPPMPPAAVNVPPMAEAPPPPPRPMQNRKTIILRPEDMPTETPKPTAGAPPPPAVPLGPPSMPSQMDRKLGDGTVPVPPPPGARPPVMSPPPVSAAPPSVGPPSAPMPKPAAPAQKPPAAAGSSSAWKMPVAVGAILGILLAAGGIVYLQNKKKNAAGAVSGGAQQQLAIATKPTGASVRVVSATGTETKCTSDCSVSLDQGTYDVTAFLDGYEPAAAKLTVGATKPTDMALTLEPQPQTVRILTDVPQGKVTLDDQPAVALQDGQLVIEKVTPGAHVLKLASPTGVAQVPFEVTPGSAPKVSGPVIATNLFALLVTTQGNKARVTTSSGPVKLMVNGQPEDPATPAGVDLKNFQGGVTELTAGEGKDVRNVKENFSPAPALTVFLKSDLNIGTLIVASSEEDSRVFLNGKEYPRHTQRGQVRIPTLGAVNVRVMKEGFDPSPQQTADIKKGAEVRLDFKLKPANQLISLLVRGGTPGAEVVVDGRSLGVVGPDGGFSATVAAGDHVVELRRDQYGTKRLQRSFRLGQPVTISGPDAILALERPVAPPPKEVAVAPPPAAAKIVLTAPRPGTMEDWDTPGMWRNEDGTYVHKGAAQITYKLPPQGTFTFTVQLQKGGNVFRAGRVRWATNYKDGKNMALYEIDTKTFWAKVIDNGKTSERAKMSHGIDSKDKSFTVQIEIAADHIIHRIQHDGQWIVLDNWSNEPGRNFADGKFAFIVQGDDQIAISDFKFQPSR